VAFGIFLGRRSKAQAAYIKNANLLQEKIIIPLCHGLYDFPQVPDQVAGNGLGKK
jgi:hypothetical protein